MYGFFVRRNEKRWPLQGDGRQRKFDCTLAFCNSWLAYGCFQTGHRLRKEIVHLSCYLIAPISGGISRFQISPLIQPFIPNRVIPIGASLHGFPCKFVMLVQILRFLHLVKKEQGSIQSFSRSRYAVKEDLFLVRRTIAQTV